MELPEALDDRRPLWSKASWALSTSSLSTCNILGADNDGLSMEAELHLTSGAFSSTASIPEAIAEEGARRTFGGISYAVLTVMADLACWAVAGLCIVEECLASLAAAVAAAATAEPEPHCLHVAQPPPLVFEAKERRSHRIGREVQRPKVDGGPLRRVAACGDLTKLSNRDDLRI